MYENVLYLINNVHWLSSAAPYNTWNGVSFYPLSIKNRRLFIVHSVKCKPSAFNFTQPLWDISASKCRRTRQMFTFLILVWLTTISLWLAILEETRLLYCHLIIYLTIPAHFQGVHHQLTISNKFYSFNIKQITTNKKLRDLIKRIPICHSRNQRNGFFDCISKYLGILLSFVAFPRGQNTAGLYTKDQGTMPSGKCASRSQIQFNEVEVAFVRVFSVTKPN